MAKVDPRKVEREQHCVSTKYGHTHDRFVEKVAGQT
jgi:hypothetical protein